MAVPQRLKHQVTIWPRNSAPRYIHKKNETLYAYKNVYTNIHSIIIFIIVKNGETQISISWWLDKWVISIQWNIIHPRKAEVLIHAMMWMNFENIILSKRSQTQKPHIIWFHSYEMFRISKSIELLLGAELRRKLRVTVNG